jgi:hypothetical protein
MPGIKSQLQYDRGTDQAYDVTVYTSEDKTTVREITGWAMSFLIKRKQNDVDASALITKTTSAGIAIGGSFDATPEDNTQKATVTIADTDTDDIYPGVYYWELKRTDAGSEARVAYGTISLNQTLHRT